MYQIISCIYVLQVYAVEEEVVVVVEAVAEEVAGREEEDTVAGVAPDMVEGVLPVQLLELCLV